MNMHGGGYCLSVVWWMPFISKENAEERAIKAVAEKNPDVTSQY
jgi:hypothetical protein